MKFEVTSKFDTDDKVIAKHFNSEVPCTVVDVEWNKDVGCFCYLCEKKNRERSWFPESSLEKGNGKNVQKRV